MSFKATLVILLLLTSLVRANDPASATPEWVHAQTELIEISAKVRSKEGELQKLIESKKGIAKNSPELQTLMADITTKHKELQSLKVQEQKAHQKLLYRFPERGATLQQLKPKPMQSIEQMEEALTLDDLLSRSLETMRRHMKASPENYQAKPKPAPGGMSIEEAPPIVIQK